MTTSPKLDATIVNPSSAPKATVIWLHGLGADGRDFVPIVNELRLPTDLPIRFIFPNAPMQPVTINNGYVMRAWYDIISLRVDEHADEKGMTETIANINALIAEEEAQGIPSNRIILGGFSQGAVIALMTSLTYPKPLGGVLALSGYLPNSEKVFKQITTNQNIPIFLAHGTEDLVVPYFLGQATHEALSKQHCNVAWHSYPMAHTVCIQEIIDIRQWLIDTLS